MLLIKIKHVILHVIGIIVYNYHPKTRDELYELVNKLIKERGNDANLNDIDTSKITNMFFCSKFNGDISKWDVSNVKNMEDMFFCSKFNSDISNWDVSNVKNMITMFSHSQFNSDISKWDVSNVRDMQGMFDNCPITEKYKPKFKI